MDKLYGMKTFVQIVEAGSLTAAEVAAGVAVGLLGIAVMVDPGLLTWVGGGMLPASGAGM